MEIEFVRTFLAVTAVANFVGAADRLHVTQSMVSARISVLETRLESGFFVGAELTPAGRRFLAARKTLVRTLEQARHNVGLPEGSRGSLTVSGRIALWEGSRPRCVDWMRRAAPDISLRLEIGFEEGICRA